MIEFLGFFLITLLAFLIARRSTGFDGFLSPSVSFTPLSTSIAVVVAFSGDECFKVDSGLSTSIVVSCRSGLGVEAISISLAERRSIRASLAGPNTFARRLLRLRLFDDDLALLAMST